MKHWYRLCVDVDHAGHPIGISYETRQGESHVHTWVGAVGDVGPFDEPVSAFNQLLDRVPIQGALFR